MAASKQLLAMLDEMKDLHRRKNAGYNGDNADPFTNFKACEAFGVPAFRGVLVRMADKWGRIQSLASNPTNEQVGESIRDTLQDMAMYALIAIYLYDEQATMAQAKAEPTINEIEDTSLCCVNYPDCLAVPQVETIRGLYVVSCPDCGVATRAYHYKASALTVWQRNEIIHLEDF